MAVFIPFDEGYLGIGMPGEGDPDAVCPGDCRVCLAQGAYCPRDLLRLEQWADAELVSEVLFGTRH